MQWLVTTLEASIKRIKNSTVNFSDFKTAMFTIRLWRRVHRPFLFLLLASSWLLLLTKVSVVSTVPSDVHVTQDPPTVSTSTVFEGTMMNTDDISIEESSEDLVQQLPFCGDQKVKKSSDNTFSRHFPPAQNDSKEDIVLRNGRQIVIATLDGRVSLLDPSGKILWSVGTGQLFSSTISSLQLTERGKFIKLIPSLTGGLYKYDGISLEAMPMNADSLLKRSFKLAQDVVITGGKEFRTFGVDIESGKVKYECGIAGCKTPTTADPQPVNSDQDPGPVLVIKKTLQTVRAIDSMTGVERWNFSVGSHELALAGVTEGCYEGAMTEDQQSEYGGQGQLTPNFRMVIPEGLVLGTDDQKQVIWKYKFDSPISQAWILDSSTLQILDPIKAHGMMEDSPSLYVGIHRQQFYVQESQAVADKLYLALEESNRSENTMEPLQISWKPTPTGLPPLPLHSTAAVTTDDDTALAPLYPTPFFVYERDTVTKFPALEAPLEPSSTTKVEDVDTDIEELQLGDESVDGTVIMAMVTLWFWWKEILGISLVTALILNVILLRPVVYLTRRRTIAEVIHQVNLFLRRNDQRQLALPSPSRDTTEVTTGTDRVGVVEEFKTRLRTMSTSSGGSTHSDDTTQVTFVSQYLKEFDPVQYLGKGAFGTVFEARKKIDDRTYAVKRISLPKKEKCRDRVMREVKSLAKLDHKNIVRYFNAWIEHPPSGWLEKNDPLWNAFTLNSPSPTCDTDGCYTGDRSSVNSAFGRIRDYSEIAIVDTPDEDSFIVFETDESRPRPVVIEEESREGFDWSTNPLPPVVPLTQDESIEKSKFFRRPTTLTLDIPSSSALSHDPDNDTGVDLDSAAGTGSPGSTTLMYLYIQQELCQKRTLQDWLRGEPIRRLNEVMSMFLQLVEAVEYIHVNKLIHRDLKPGNIFLAGSHAEGEMTVKIGDFGLATTLVGDGRDSGDGQEMDHGLDRANIKLTGQVGTQLYMAPEQAQRKAYDHKVDIFSLGLIFFELLVPLRTEMEKHTELYKLREMKFPTHFIKSHPDQFDLIQDMVSHDPNSRPDASEIKTYLSKLKAGHGHAFRSRSYPEYLTNRGPGPGSIRSRTHDKDRVLYKTHSAM